MNRKKYKIKFRYSKHPNFDSGTLAEPLLAFGGRHQHVDPKLGLGLYGPYSLVGQSKPQISNIIVGLVGPGNMLADTELWLQKCSGIITNDGRQPYLYPHFPGFNEEYPFQCKFTFGDTWREVIASKEIEQSLASTNFYDRIKMIVKIYIQAIETLSQRDPKPHVILCCIPQSVIDLCTVKVTKAGEQKRRRKTKAERKAEKEVQKGQGFLFYEMDPTLGIEDQEDSHQNLRRGLKAEGMQFGIPTQIIWPRTIELNDNDSKKDSAQDIATRAWNLTTALYHKAGGTPWRLADVDPSICFVGISFYREILENNPLMRTSMAQTFTTAGDGHVLRGNSFEWSDSKNGKSPHLNYKSTASLMRDVLDLYKRQNRGSLPNRIVVHKSSRYWDEELKGFKDSCKQIPRADFVSIGYRKIQFYRLGDYPPLRGTFIKFSDNELLLYTVGYVPFLRSYPGARVPQPLEILEHHGDTPWNVILQEILALTKMNWNTTYFACKEPITLAFSHKVGQVLAELPQDMPLRPEYRFYM